MGEQGNGYNSVKDKINEYLIKVIGFVVGIGIMAITYIYNTLEERVSDLEDTVERYEMMISQKLLDKIE